MKKKHKGSFENSHSSSMPLICFHSQVRTYKFNRLFKQSKYMSLLNTGVNAYLSRIKILGKKHKTQHLEMMVSSIYEVDLSVISHFNFIFNCSEELSKCTPWLRRKLLIFLVASSLWNCCLRRSNSQGSSTQHSNTPCDRLINLIFNSLLNRVSNCS